MYLTVHVPQVPQVSHLSQVCAEWGLCLACQPIQNSPLEHTRCSCGCRTSKLGSAKLLTGPQTAVTDQRLDLLKQLGHVGAD